MNGIEALFHAFLRTSVSSGIAAVILLLISPFLNKRYKVKWRYYIWLILAIYLVIPYHPAILLPAAPEIPFLDAVSLPSGRKDPANETSGSAKETPPIQMAAEEAAVSPLAKQMAVKDFWDAFVNAMPILWLVCCIAIMLIQVLSYRHFRRRVLAEGKRKESGFAVNILRRLFRELRLRGTLDKIRIIQYERVKSPMLIGWIHPIIILPDAYHDDELYFILKHELVHLKRHDTLFKLFLSIAGAIHWFNPVIHIMRREAVIDMELSCDEKVIEDMPYSMRREYTETLMLSIMRQFNKKESFLTVIY